MSTDNVPEQASETRATSSEQPASPTVDNTMEPAAEPAVAPVGEAATERTSEPVSEEAPAEEPGEPLEDFADILSQFERSHTHKPASGARQIEGIVISVS